MKAYDFECPKGHVTEHFLKEFEDRVICEFEGCREVGEYRPSFWYSSPIETARRIQEFA